LSAFSLRLALTKLRSPRSPAAPRPTRRETIFTPSKTPGGKSAVGSAPSAAELVALAPDVLLAGGGTSVQPLLRAIRTVPIVFANVPDPVGWGIVDSLARPGGNITGFMQSTTV
jgi:putative ABC transport system substrate-binding protein